MKQKKISNWLTFIIIGMCLCCIVIYALVVPSLGRSIVDENPEFAHYFWPWLCFICATGIPCIAALVLGLKLAVNIGFDRTFSDDSASLLKWIAILAGIDAAFFFIGNIVLLFLNMNHPGIVLFSFIVVFIGIAVSVVFAAIAHHVKKAAELQEQSDLTI